MDGLLQLMGQVRDITAQLAVTAAPALSGRSEVQALALRLAWRRA